MSELASPNPNPEQQQIFTLSRNSTTSSSMSMIEVDELSPFGATKQGRLPALIKLNANQANLSNDDSSEEHGRSRKTVSMPIYNGSDIEQVPRKALEKQESSLPAGMEMFPKEINNGRESMESEAEDLSDDFHLVGLPSADLIGPSLPAPLSARELASALDWSANATTNQFDDDEQEGEGEGDEQSNNAVGDSLVEMIINLRNENQDLIHALETNNEYVKQRLDEFKRISEELKQQDTKFSIERSDYEQQIRKLKHQNTILSDKVKTLEAKLMEAKVDIKGSLQANGSSEVGSIQSDSQKMYPDLSYKDFNNSDQETTMQVDAKPTNGDQVRQTSTAREMSDTGEKIGSMSAEEMKKRFDAVKTDFYASDDRMEQCDKLEKQLDDIGMRDYEICLLQQQLNIYRQDFRLERMANLEAKMQIERLKNDIDKLCLERLKDRSRIYGEKGRLEGEKVDREVEENCDKNKHFYQGPHVRFDPGAAAGAVVSKLSHQLSKKAARSAAKAAKYASKQAYREERAAAAAAVAAANAATNQDTFDTSQGHQGHRRHHSRHFGGHHRGIKSEVVNDLWSTANRAMLTGYKMASTHVNNALDRLSQPATNDQTVTPASKQPSDRQEGSGGRVEPSAPPMGDSSMD